jgi:hypothetical protein
VTGAVPAAALLLGVALDALYILPLLLEEEHHLCVLGDLSCCMS